MAKYTENIRLAQPEGSDYYDIEVFNHNSELIDKKIGEMDNSLSTIKEGATREKAGIVQLGTEEGKALEGMMLARLAGCIGYGGDIQDEGVKNPNYIYYDRNTRKMYKCLNQNSDVSANVANFIPLDNNSLLDRLENLITLKENKTKISFTPISNVNLDNIKESGYYVSPSWGNNILGLPSELSGYNDKAFYLQVFSLNDVNSYCQQILYSFKGKIFYRAITGAGSSFSNWIKFI